MTTKTKTTSSAFAVIKKRAAARTFTPTTRLRERFDLWAGWVVFGAVALEEARVLAYYAQGLLERFNERRGECWRIGIEGWMCTFGDPFDIWGSEVWLSLRPSAGSIGGCAES